MENFDAYQPNQDERFMATLAHLSMLIPLMRFFGPIYLWATQRDKSRFITFHALQALAYQAVLMIVSVLVGTLFYIVFLAVALALMPSYLSSPNESSFLLIPFISFLLPFAVVVLLSLVQIVIMAYSIVGAVLTMQGRPFRYLLLGRMVEKYFINLDRAGASPTT
jgi:uncharacterized Tic20 family protein